MTEGLTRLQRIQAFGLLEIDDCSWLINTIKEQQEEIERLKKTKRVTDNSWRYLVERAEMYERALNLIIKNTVSGHVGNIAKKALEGKF